MVMGRPTKYKKEYCTQVIKFMSDGNSGVQFAAHIGVCKDTILEWVKEHADFSLAYKQAMTLCEAYWEKVAQAKTVKKVGGSDAVLMFYLKNRFKWSEKIETNNTNTEITFTTQIGEDGTVNREQS